MLSFFTKTKTTQLGIVQHKQCYSDKYSCVFDLYLVYTRQSALHIILEV